MMVKDYELRLRQLERQCRELSGENLQLQQELLLSCSRQAQSRELNLRLGHEVREARCQRDEAEAKALMLNQELDHLQQLLKPSQESEESLPSLPSPPPGLAPADSDECAWGWQGDDRVYGQPLLLAHREKSLQIALGPPGLAGLRATCSSWNPGFGTMQASDVQYSVAAKDSAKDTWIKVPRRKARTQKKMRSR